MSPSSNRKVGVWLIGAFGGVGTTIAVGISAVKRKLAPTVGMPTELPRFQPMGFIGFDSIVVGGHDVRRSSYRESSRELYEHSRVFSPEILSGCADDLNAWSENVRPGLVRGSGRPVEEFADWKHPADAPPLELAERLADDLRAFAKNHSLDHVVVVNVSSSEPLPPIGPEHDSWATLSASLSKAGASGSDRLPASSIYGLAAVLAGASYVNFTPSVGLNTKALEERAIAAKILYGGKDGKTGETLMKAVLAPMFVRRNWEVMSWVGHNILGNRDGLVLQDPENKQGKLDSKGHLIQQILGYAPQTLVSIEHIESMGDWKTAWDHIHFQGFLGTKMSLQFIWQGCDSLLAAPLAIDLVRWTDLAKTRGETGCMKHLACYFKTPMHVFEQDFFKQWDMLEAYAK